MIPPVDVRSYLTERELCSTEDYNTILLPGEKTCNTMLSWVVTPCELVSRQPTYVSEKQSVSIYITGKCMIYMGHKEGKLTGQLRVQESGIDWTNRESPSKAI
jgi:hypothetical protein